MEARWPCISWATSDFDKAYLLARVVVDGSGETTGLLLAPSAQANATFSAPAYANPPRLTESDLSVGADGADIKVKEEVRYGSMPGLHRDSTEGPGLVPGGPSVEPS